MDGDAALPRCLPAVNELRRKKLESRILRSLAEHIQKRRTKDERLGFVSIARVKLLDDLSRAEIFVSLFDPDQRANQATLKALRRHAGAFQSDIARELRLRQTPQFEFEIDESVKEGDRILDLLMEGEGPEQENTPGPSADAE